MEQYGNDNFNVERVLRENINGHELFEMKITEDQLHETISCKDSPYIRAIGFLYLRYVGDPKDLLSWCEPYLSDEEKFHPSGKGYGKEVTIGQYVTDILLSQNYFETIFTRIPKKVTDDIVAELQSQELPHAVVGNGGQGGPDRRGADDGRARPASVKASLSVAMGQRAPNRAGVTEDVAQRVARREDMSADHRKEKPSAPRDRQGEKERDWGDRAGGGARDGHNDRDRESDRYRDRERDRGGQRDWRDNDRHGDGGRGEGRNDRFDRDRGGRGGRARGGQQDGGGRGRGHGDSFRKYNGRDRGEDRGGRPPRAPAANSTVFGRSAADVFGKTSGTPHIENDSGELDGSWRQSNADDGVKIGRRRR